VTIPGNTTIPMPANGPHSIQLFGNDSQGYIYQSDIRYFTVDYWDTTNPVISELNSDFSVFQGDQASFSWKITDTHPDYYEIYRNGMLVKNDFYTSDSSITFSFLNWTLGNLFFEIIAYDTYGNNNSDSVLISIIQRTDNLIFLEPGLVNQIDLTSSHGLYIEFTSNSLAFLEVFKRNYNFPGLPSIRDNESTCLYYSFKVFDIDKVENESVLENIMIRFYYDPYIVNNPLNLYLLHYDDNSMIWEFEDITKSMLFNYIEFTTTELSYFCLLELVVIVPPPDFTAIFIIIFAIIGIASFLFVGAIVYNKNHISKSRISKKDTQKVKKEKPKSRKQTKLIEAQKAEKERLYREQWIKNSFCPFCNKSILVEQEFCTYCGTKIKDTGNE
jgi:hypothetical protein